MIKNKADQPRKQIIDLTGPDGNAFVLLGIATRFGRQLGRTGEEIEALLTEMESGDYENLVAVFDREFGEIVTLYR